MASDANGFDINSFIAQLQQQQQSRQQGSAALAGGSVAHQESKALKSILTEYLKAQSGADSSASSQAAPQMDQALTVLGKAIPMPQVAPSHMPNIQQQNRNASGSVFSIQNLPRGMHAQLHSLQEIAASSSNPRRNSSLPTTLLNQLVQTAAPSSTNSLDLSSHLPSISAEGTNKSLASSFTQSAGNNNNKPSAVIGLKKPPSPVPIPVLQTWDLAQLESYAQHFKDCHQTIPNAVNILLEYHHKKETRRDKKRIANRKSARESRARKKQLIDELTATNAKLRRQALVLSYLPDPVIAIGTDGKINFCSVQMGRVLKHGVEDLEGASIDDIMVPASRDKVHRLIQDLVAAAYLVGQAGGQKGGARDGGNSSGERMDQNASGEFSSSPNAISQASGRFFPMLEVNLYEEHEADVSSDPSSARSTKNVEKLKPSYTTMSSMTEKSLLSSSEISMTDDGDAPPAKIAKTASKDKEEIGKHCAPEAMNVDDIMGAPVTANNTHAKLSSLVHRYEKGSKEADSTTNSAFKKTVEQRPAFHHQGNIVRGPSHSKEGDSVDSGYRNSSEGSDNYTSSISDSYKLMKTKGKRLAPLSAACTVRLICNDLTTIVCEITSSIRARTPNDVDSTLGILDPNPTPAFDAPNQEEIELLLCFRLLSQGKAVGEDLRFRPMISKIKKSKEVGKRSPPSNLGGKSSDVNLVAESAANCADA